MDSGAPAPALCSDETGLVCAYVTVPPKSESTTVIRFEGLLHYEMGYPNDEALHAHPLYRFGLRPYGFYVVENSPLIAELDRRNEVQKRHVAGSYLKRFRHWVITFHDETLEVVARNAQVVGITALPPKVAARTTPYSSSVVGDKSPYRR